MIDSDSNLKKARILTVVFVFAASLVFSVSENTSAVKFYDPQIVTRGLVDGTLKFDDDDVVKKKILPVYLNMALYAGKYLAAQGSDERAIAKFKQALTIDPSFEPAKTALAASQYALQKLPTK